MVNHVLDLPGFAALGNPIEATIGSKRIAPVRFRKVSLKTVEVLTRESQPFGATVQSVHCQVSKTGPGGVARVHLIDAGLQVVAAAIARPEGHLNGPAHGAGPRQTLLISVQLRGLDLGLDRDSLIVVEVALVDDCTSPLRQLLVANAPP